jgi:hypothetical protein
MITATPCATCNNSANEWEMTHTPELGKFAYVCETCWLTN